MSPGEDDWLTDSLTILTVNTDDAHWPSPGELRTRARRRRLQRRTAVGVVGVIVVAAAVVLPLQGTTQTPAPFPNRGLDVIGHSNSAVELAANVAPGARTPPSSDYAQVATAEEGFSLSLLRQLNARGNKVENVVTSPSSLATVLAMLELGARGSTSSQIAAVLGTAQLSSSQQAAGWSALSADEAVAARQTGIDLDSADSLWMQSGLRIVPDFMSALSKQFVTGVWQVNFTHDPAAANNAINSWVNTETHGLITQLFTPGAINSMTALVLANAVYFKGAWQQGFDPSKTALQYFERANGSKVHVPFMSATETLRLSPYLRPGAKPKNGQLNATDLLPYRAVELPYKGDRFAALAIMPTSGTLAQFVQGLTTSSLNRLVRTLRMSEVSISMPRFTVSANDNLNGDLEAMGIRDAFENADFSGISPTPLALQQVQQRAFVEVNEQGTVAAAATGGAAQATAAPPGITLDHPFLFIVRDTTTGTILFDAEVENPSSS